MRKLNKIFFQKHPELRDYFLPKFKNKFGYLIYKNHDDLAMLLYSIILIILLVSLILMLIKLALISVPLRTIIFL